MSPLLAAARALAVVALAAAALARPVTFKTADGWTIAAAYHAPKRGRPVVILVHGVGAGKGEWDELAPLLWPLGLGTLALDLRGHGGSTGGPRGAATYRTFVRAADWQSAAQDIAAAQEFLSARGTRRFALVGGSIGANLCSQNASGRKAVLWLALLSPGRDYRGVGLADPAQPTLLAASPGDAYAYETIFSRPGRPGLVAAQARQGHGAQMLRDPEFLKLLLAWIGRQSVPAEAK